MLIDEGNRLIGTFTLPHIMTDTAPEGAKAKNIYVVLDIDGGKQRVYEAGYIKPITYPGEHPVTMGGYYKFEIMKDNQPAHIQLLIERNDGAWILGKTGEVASAGMAYVTGDLPVIDPAAPTGESRGEADSSLLEAYSAAGGKAGASILLVKKGGLEPGKRYVYVNPDDGAQTELVYSPAHQAYVGIVGKKDASLSDVQTRNGAVKELRPGVVADDRNSSINGTMRARIIPEDLFYLYSRLTPPAAVPAGDPLRVLALDVDGNCNLTPADLRELMDKYMEQ